ncbi:MAG TPA: hypothetical protein VGN72_19855 [Tepidisphaeraceae bacterium]|jgi:hypothetical protein|nr:hypothetical protein [Tepidisphaeraceae bacterium]
MPKETLTIDTMGNIDEGSLRIAANNAFKLLAQDLADRPVLNKARKIVITLEMKPVVNTNSHSPQLDSVEYAWHIAQKVPAIGSSGGVMQPQQDGTLAFHSDLPDSPNDETIMDEAERRRAELRERDRNRG